MPCAPNSRAFAQSSALSAFARTFSRRTSSAQPRIVSKSSLICGGTSADLADDHAAARAVDRDHVALVQLVAADPHRSRVGVDAQPLAAGDARLAHPARHDSCVRRHAAVRGEHALRPDHPVDVVRARLPADEDHRLAGLAVLLRRVGVEHDRAAGRTGRRIQPVRRNLVRRGGIEHRVQQLVELHRVDARDRLLAGDQSFVRHVGRRPERGRRRALRRARLQDVERAFLDRELDVLHVAVVLLESRHRLHQLVVRLR